jgi:hypothetical protein
LFEFPALVRFRRLPEQALEPGHLLGLLLLWTLRRLGHLDQYTSAFGFRNVSVRRALPGARQKP